MQQTQSEANEQAKDLEMANAKIKVDLDVTSQQLMVNNVELANSRIELQNHRNEIDVRSREFSHHPPSLIQRYIFCYLILAETERRHLQPKHVVHTEQNKYHTQCHGYFERVERSQRHVKTGDCFACTRRLSRGK